MALRFDGRVAIVTGAGAGLGRVYALALAARGASVVVNDLGSSVSGEGSHTRAADTVVAEIRAAGGSAVADYHSVEDGEKIVDTALRAFGGVHILINNAGILRDRAFINMKPEDWDILYKVHLKGTYKCTRAAWNVMRDQKFGRVVLVSSAAGLYGNIGQANYAAFKLAVVGLGNVLALEGDKYNIKVNTIAPIAGSRLTATVLPEDMLQMLKPEYVSPVVEYLCHDSCPENGAIFELGGGWVGKLRWQRSRGAFLADGERATPEQVRDAWGTINDFSEGTTFPTSNQEAFGIIMGHLASAPASASSSSSAAGATAPASKASVVIETFRAAISRDGPALAKQMNARIAFLLAAPKSAPTRGVLVDLKAGTSGSVTEFDPSATPPGGPAELTITLAEDDFVALGEGMLEPQKAFMAGKLKVKGNVTLATKLSGLLAAARKVTTASRL